MSNSQFTPNETDVDTTEDRVSDVMTQLDASEFTIEEYRQLAETLLISLGIAYEDQITEDSELEEIQFLTSTATRFQMAYDMISMEREDIEFDEDNEDDENDED
jgi:hypothetical protein